MLPLLLASLLAAPNVVFISMDTLRADHLGLYGHPHDTSPNLDRLAAQGRVFDDMVCEVPLTGPSFCAMMTSQYPRATGVTRNGLRLAEDVPTVAEEFRAAGYETLCVTSNWTLKGRLSGLDRGFDVYDDEFREKRWGLIKSERDAEEVVQLSLDVLANRDPEKPMFAWFHFSDPHAPYKLRKGHRVSEESHYAEDPGASEKARYDSEIRYADERIGRILDALPKENTFVVFAGDHGESLHEHDYVGHGRRIYQVGLKIPFFVAGPGIEPGRTAEHARGIDIGTTLLGLAGLDAPSPMSGVDLSNGGAPAGRVRVVETYGGAVPHLPGAKAIMKDKGPQYQGVLADGWKLIRNGRSTELFELTTDPHELVNLAEEHPERVETLATLIDEWSAEIASAQSEAAALSEEDMEALESLGYIE